MKPILLVEDNEDDIFLVKKACERSGFPHSLHIVRDGQQAISYLSGDGDHANRARHPLPHLVFLDINMPVLNGHEVLKWIRAQTRFMELPVVMLTTSKESADLQQAYALGANSYLRKGDDMAEFGQGMRIILKYWLGMNIGPK